MYGQYVLVGYVIGALKGYDDNGHWGVCNDDKGHWGGYVDTRRFVVGDERAEIDQFTSTSRDVVVPDIFRTHCGWVRGCVGR